jgi:hypothetical protein
MQSCATYANLWNFPDFGADRRIDLSRVALRMYGGKIVARFGGC